MMMMMMMMMMMTMMMMMGDDDDDDEQQLENIHIVDIELSPKLTTTHHHHSSPEHCASRSNVSASSKSSKSGHTSSCTPSALVIWAWLFALWRLLSLGRSS
eukprot:3587135-Karenia_brevis.AAC.1